VANERHVVVMVQCPRCETKQKVHVAARPDFGQMANAIIRCINCDNHFKVAVSDRIIDGPFPA
jgi:transcription elongation factor Elf1